MFRMFAGPTMKEVTRQEDLNIRRAKRQNESERNQLKRGKDALTLDIQRAIATNNMKLAASLSQNLARMNRRVSKLEVDGAWLTECQHEVLAMSDVASKQAVVKGMVSLAARQNKNMNIKKLIKQQRDANQAMTALRHGRDIMNETMDEMVEEDNTEIDEEAEGKAILDALMDQDALRNTDRMPDAPMRMPGRTVPQLSSSEQDVQARLDKLTDKK